MHKDFEKILFSQDQLASRVKELGRAITRDYAGQAIFMIGVLKGAIVFMSDLCRAIDSPVEIDFMAVSSYGSETSSSGVVRILKDLDCDVRDKHVLIVEDIIDSGLTLNYLIDYIKVRNPRSVKICTLLNKPDRRKVAVEVDYNGFNISDEFVVGYGLDYAEKYRNLPYIAILSPEVYQGN